MNEERKNTITVEMKTEGFEEAGEKIEVIADALDQMPATINLKAKDCGINIHNSIWIDRREENELEKERQAEPSEAEIKVTGKAEEESERKPITVIPRDKLNRALTRMVARSIKESCAKEGCATCPFKNMEDGPYCELTGARPADWKL